MANPILMISYEAPPRLSAESIITGKTLKALSTATVAPPVIDLVCASNGDEVPADVALEDLLPKTARVHRIDPVPQGRKTLLQRIIGGKGGWQKAAASKGSALFPAEHKKPALLYSRSHPPASHLAALDLIEGPMQGVPWVAHFSDPWSQHAYYKSPVTRAALARYESQVFAAASRLIFVSDTLRDTMLAKQDDSVKAKARVLPHLYDSSLYGKATLPQSLHSSGKQKTIAHIGDLYGLRSPETLFLALQKMVTEHPEQAHTLRLWLVGKIEPAFLEMENHAKIEKNLAIVPPVPYFQSLATMAAADVVLVVEAPVRNSVFFPSKIVDYLGARKPILAITPKGSLTARLMTDWKQPWVDVKDVDGIAAQLSKVARGELWTPPDAAVLDQYSGVNVGRGLAAIFSELQANV